MMKYLLASVMALAFFMGCEQSGGGTVYNPTNAGYVSFIEEPAHVYVERADDGIADTDTFYVAVDGDDAAAGSIDAPWKTIQAGMDRISPGQKLYVRGGVYSEVVWIRKSGQPGLPLVLSAYPGEEAILDGIAIPPLPPDQFWGMISATGQEYIHIRGLKIRNAHRAGITVDNTDHVVIEDVLTYNTLGSGITSYWGDDITVEHNEIILACNLNMYQGSWYPRELACIQECLTVAGADGFSIAYNHVHHNGYAIEFGGEGIDAKAGSCHGRVYKNTVHDLNKLGIYIDSYGYTNDIDVEANDVSRCMQWGICVAAEDDHITENIRVFNNIVYDNDRVGIGIENWGRDATHRMRNIHIFNNTIVCNSEEVHTPDPWGCGIHIDAPNAENIYIYNNLIAFNNNRQLDVLSFSNSRPTPRNLVIDNNLVYYNPEHDLFTNPGTNHINMNPLFSDITARDGQLASGSPALGAASRTRLSPGRDFYDNPRASSGPFDIGAVEQ
jgi:hypothetical protein